MDACFEQFGRSIEFLRGFQDRQNWKSDQQFHSWDSRAMLEDFIQVLNISPAFLT